MEGNTNFDYTRVSPRDLFNEAKLLKCLGQLALHIHDAKCPGVTFKDSGSPFKIGLHDAGYLTAGAGIKFSISGEPLWLGISYNSRAPFPLICMVDWEEIEVFNEDGSINDDFLALAAQ